MLVTYFVNFRKLNDHLFGKELFMRFSASAIRKLPSIYVFSYFPFDFEGRMSDLIYEFLIIAYLFTLPPLAASRNTSLTIDHWF